MYNYYGEKREKKFFFDIFVLYMYILVCIENMKYIIMMVI